MRINAAEGARVPWQCSSAKGKSVLRQALTGACRKGSRLIFLHYPGRCGNASLSALPRDRSTTMSGQPG